MKKILLLSFTLATFLFCNSFTVKKPITGRWETSFVCNHDTNQQAWDCMDESITECQQQYLVDDLSPMVSAEINSQGQPTGKWCYSYRYFYTGN